MTAQIIRLHRTIPPCFECKDYSTNYCSYLHQLTRVARQPNSKCTTIGLYFVPRLHTATQENDIA